MTKRICLISVLTFLVATVFYFWFIVPMNWIVVSSARSPGGDWTAHHLVSTAEGGTAPYGEHIVISKTSQFYGEFYGETIFAGYCKSDVQYRWEDKNVFEIKCEEGTYVKQMKTYGDMKIKYLGLRKNN